MPQFLRAVRALCKIYPYYRHALQRGEITGIDCGSPHSVPASPAITSDSFQSSSNVRRAGSFSSLLESNSRHNHPRTQTTPAAIMANPIRVTRRGFRGHRRTHSHTLTTEEAHRDTTEDSSTNEASSSSHLQHGTRSPSVGTMTPGVAGGRVGRDKLSLEDPFQKLEVVWASLESWFDLILVEVEKTKDEMAGSEHHGRLLLKQRIQSIDSGGHSNQQTDDAASDLKSSSQAPSLDSAVSSATTASVVKEEENGCSSSTIKIAFQAQDTNGRESSEVGLSRRNRGEMKLSISNELAAAIVNSTPVERRVAYLRCVYMYTY